MTKDKINKKVRFLGKWIIQKPLNFFGKWFWTKPIFLINLIFDRNLNNYKEIYQERVKEALPEDANREEVRDYYKMYVNRYYEHKKDRRSIFVFFIVSIPTFFTGIFWLKGIPNREREVISLILFSVYLTWAVIHLLTVYRRKVYKKSKIIIEYQKAYNYLPRDFMLTKEISYNKEELTNNYISTTNIYRFTVILVTIALLYLLYETLFLS